MTNITRLHHVLPLSPEVVKAINETDSGLLDIDQELGL
jgi:hypothetical protein